MKRRVLKLDEIDKTADTAAKMLAASDTYNGQHRPIC